MNWASQRLRAMQTGNARQLAAESVVEAACCRACCQMMHILVKHAKGSCKILKAATWGFPSATEGCRICMIVIVSASPRRRILVLELRSVSQRIPAHSCLHSAQLSPDHIISSCASMQITFRGQARQHKYKWASRSRAWISTKTTFIVLSVRVLDQVLRVWEAMGAWFTGISCFWGPPGGPG